jgi:hypothetical protein
MLLISLHDQSLHLIYKAECLYLIQIHISEPIWTKLCTHLPLSLEETAGYVWYPKMFDLFYLFHLLRRERVPNPRHEMAAGARVLRDSVISMIFGGVGVTSRKWRCSRRQFCVPQESSATALYPRFLVVFVWRYGNDVVADDSFAFLKSHPRLRYIHDSWWCSCDVTEMT